MTPAAVAAWRALDCRRAMSQPAVVRGRVYQPTTSMAREVCW